MVSLKISLETSQTLQLTCSFTNCNASRRLHGFTPQRRKSYLSLSETSKDGLIRRSFSVGRTLPHIIHSYGQRDVALRFDSFNVLGLETYRALTSSCPIIGTGLSPADLPPSGQDALTAHNPKGSDHFVGALFGRRL